MKKLLLTFNIILSFALFVLIIPKPQAAAVGAPCNNCTSNAGVCSVRDCPAGEVCSISSTCPTTCSSLPDYGDGAGVGTCQPAGGTPTATPTIPPAGFCVGWSLTGGGGCQTLKSCSASARCPLDTSTCQPSPASAPCVKKISGPITSWSCACVITNVSPIIIRPADCNPAFGSKGINTALGCIPTKLESIVPWLLRALAGVAGGIALLLLFYGGLTYVMAGGEKTGVEEAKGIITAAISGLLLIIFSVLILKVIGVDILGIPAITVINNSGGGFNVPGT